MFTALFVQETSLSGGGQEGGAAEQAVEGCLEAGHVTFGPLGDALRVFGRVWMRRRASWPGAVASWWRM